MKKEKKVFGITIRKKTFFREFLYHIYDSPKEEVKASISMKKEKKIKHYGNRDFFKSLISRGFLETVTQFSPLPLK